MVPLRRGLAFGGSAGLGGMNNQDDTIRCDGCGGAPVAVGASGYVGFYLGPRLAVLGDLSATSRPLDGFYSDYLVQTQLTGNVRYWATPRLWVQGGLGFSNLSESYEDEFGTVSDTVGAGGALVLAAGFDFLVGPGFAWDVNGRVNIGTYDGLGDTITTGMVNIGINWFQ